MKCPHCDQPIDVRFVKAPPMQSATLNTSSGDVGELLGLVNDTALNQWEQEFIASIRERFEKYGERTLVTEKQLENLRKIAAK